MTDLYYTKDQLAKLRIDEHGTLHEEYTAHIFADSVYMGNFNFDAGSHAGLGFKRSGLSVFCHHCGNIWASFTVNDSTGRVRPFELWHTACKDHYDQWNIAGSLVNRITEPLLDLLPEPVLKREFQILLAQLDKELQHEQEAQSQSFNLSRASEERNAPAGAA